MGRQVQAEIEDLALAGCLVQIAFFVEDDEGTAVVVRRPIVDFPDGSRISSYHGDASSSTVATGRVRTSGRLSSSSTSASRSAGRRQAARKGGRHFHS